MQRIYFDNNATTAIDPAVLSVLTETYQRQLGNPSSTHSFGQEAKGLLAQSRRSIASFFGVQPQELFFTSGGTEAINLILRGFFGPKPLGHLVTSNVEHSAVYQTACSLHQQGCEVSFLPAGKLGTVSVEAVRDALRPDTRMIALIGVNNETGVKTDVPAIAALAKQQRIPLFIDGVAWLGKEAVVMSDGVSAMAFSAHKFHGPKGIGFAIVRNGFKLHPFVTGGGQEENRRSGTENIPAIAAMAKAMSLLEEQQHTFESHMRLLRDRFELLLMERVKGASVNGEGIRVCNVSNIAFEGVDGEALLMQLDMAGIAASHGSACSAGALEPSRILLNMDMTQARAAESLRFSFSRFNTMEEVEKAVDIICHILA